MILNICSDEKIVSKEHHLKCAKKNRRSRQIQPFLTGVTFSIKNLDLSCKSL